MSGFQKVIDYLTAIGEVLKFRPTESLLVDDEESSELRDNEFSIDFILNENLFNIAMQSQLVRFDAPVSITFNKKIQARSKKVQMLDFIDRIEKFVCYAINTNNFRDGTDYKTILKCDLTDAVSVYDGERHLAQITLTFATQYQSTYGFLTL